MQAQLIGPFTCIALRYLNIDVHVMCVPRSTSSSIYSIGLRAFPVFLLFHLPEVSPCRVCAAGSTVEIHVLINDVSLMNH
jgi:hypothetical protein